MGKLPKQQHAIDVLMHPLMPPTLVGGSDCRMGD